MSKFQFEKEIEAELKRLNDSIDRKIIRGISYAKESRRHKFLLSQLRNMRRAAGNREAWFKKSFAFVSSFIF